MKGTILRAIVLLIIAVGVGLAQTSSFTYQGKLADAGLPANGTYDLTFKLYDTLANGTPVGSGVVLDDVVVSDGNFSVDLDFGAAAFSSGASRFLQIEVRGPGASVYTPLVPRQPLTSSPYAVKAASATSADSLSDTCILCIRDEKIDTVSAGKVTGVLSYFQGGTGLGGPGPFPVAGLFLRSNGAGLALQGLTASDVPNNSVTTPKLVDGSITELKIADYAVATDKLGDNAVITGKIADASITAAKIANGGVTTPKLADASVTRAKLAADFKNGFDPQLVAMQRWDLIPVQKNSATVGRRPSGLAFDGTFMYVSNKLDNTVTRVRTGTGLVEGSPIPVGTAPTALAFDGSYIYVASSGANDVIRILASTGQVAGTIPVGNGPSAFAFDGTYMNVGNAGSSSVTRIDVTSGMVASTIPVPFPPVSMVFDGTWIYVACNNGGGGGGAVQKINASTGEIQSTSMPSSNNRSVLFDGTFIYAGGPSGFRRIRASTGNLEINPLFSPGGSNNISIFDGTHIYTNGVNGFGSGAITKLNLNGLGVEEGSISYAGTLTSFGFDGTYTYAALDLFDNSSGLPVPVNGLVIRF